MRYQLTDLKCRKAAAKKKPFLLGDGEGLFLKIMPSGRRIWVLQKVWQAGQRQSRRTLGRYPGMSLDEARKVAAAWSELHAKGLDPAVIEAERKQKAAAEVERAANSKFEAVYRQFIKRYVRAEGRELRSADEIERIFEFYVLPAWRGRVINDIRRRDVQDLLDRIEDRKVRSPDPSDQGLYGGPAMADHTLAWIRKLFNWHATRDDEFVSPIVRGMARTRPKERARDRILSDEEIRLIWAQLDKVGRAPDNASRALPSPFADIVKMLFLTAQRRSEVAQMQWSQINKDGRWAIPKELYKTGRPQLVPLPKQALEIVKARPKLADGDFVFSFTGEFEFQAWSNGKRQLDALILKERKRQAIALGENPNLVEPIPYWVLHDIRRTARSLMSRAGVRPDIAERVLGHVIPGVGGVYDRHEYLAEKQEALAKLASVLDRIIHPLTDNILDISSRRP